METQVQSSPLMAFAKGNLDAFEVLFRETQREVYRWILRIVRDAAVAEELTLEAFWRAYRAHAHFDPSRNFGAWVRRIATNVAIDHVKRAPRPTEELIDVAAPEQGDAAVQRDTREHVRKAFQALPVKLRIPALLALVEDMPQREIAEAMEISEAAVKARVFRATQLLRKKLTQMGITP